MAYQWLSMEYVTRFNKKQKHTASVQRKSDIKEILDRYGVAAESVLFLSLNGKEYDAKELLGNG